jgi:PEP-CTERM motif
MREICVFGHQIALELPQKAFPKGFEAMRLLKLTTLVVLSALLVSLPAFADSWTVFSQPTAAYTSQTNDFGGGDGSGSAISSLGPFTFSSPLIQDSVPGSWATWNCPPATESCTPNVLYTNGATSLTMAVSGSFNTVGFELEPDLFQAEDVSATFLASDGSTFTLILTPNGSAGALLFAVQNDTAGATITSVTIVDLAGDDFAIAQLRAGTSSTSVPEPASLFLFGSGLLGLGGFARKRMKKS